MAGPRIDLTIRRRAQDARRRLLGGATCAKAEDSSATDPGEPVRDGTSVDVVAAGRAVAPRATKEKRGMTKRRLYKTEVSVGTVTQYAARNHRKVAR